MTAQRSKKVKIRKEAIFVKTSDLISAFISDLLDESDGSVELRRNELAQRFNVVPSQINYVITSRFSPEHGYIIESHRGGGGCIRIHRVTYTDGDARIMHVVNAIGKELNQFDAMLFVRNLAEAGLLSAREALLMRAAVSDASLGAVSEKNRDGVRAKILKNMLLSIR